MFDYASSFNQNLSAWCVSKILSEPYLFSANCPLVALNKPKWGTCSRSSDWEYGAAGDSCTATCEGKNKSCVQSGMRAMGTEAEANSMVPRLSA
ncbi:hypothetical protein M9435_006948 [Picochlorum sp. BPE23]|nr:hypothetical protein M9435_006948 [Picochlorum sp. BPE23]